MIHINYHIYLCQKSCTTRNLSDKVVRDEIRSVILEASFGNGINLYVENELKKINLEQGRSNKSIIPDYNYRLIIFSQWELL